MNSYNSDKIFFEELELPAAKYKLDVGSGAHAEETGKMLIGIEKVLKEEKKMVLEKIYLYYSNIYGKKC